MAQRLMDRTCREAASALRSLRRAPAFTTTTVLVLSFGIGTATAMFAILHAVLLKPLPVTAQDRLVLPQTLDARGTDLALLRDEFKELRQDSRTMVALAGVAHQGAFDVAFLDRERTIDLKAAWVTGNFFEVLGTRPALGRLFNSADESQTEPSVTVISYRIWRQRFGGDPGVLGHRLVSPYTQHAVTIVGVAPAGLDYPPGTESWSPFVYAGGLNVVGRLAPGSTMETARAEFETIMRGLYARRPGYRPEFAATRVRDLSQAVEGDVKPVLLALTGAVVLLLVIACVNVGTLILLRLTMRAHEIAIRLSLGAGTADILRQLVAESGALTLAGGVVGLGLAWALLRALPALAPTALPRLDAMHLASAPPIAGVVMILVIATIGIVPAVTAGRPAFMDRLRLDVRTGGTTAPSRRRRQWFVTLQTAVALVMLSGAGLLVRTLERLNRIDLGYQPEHLSLLTVTVPVTLENSGAQFAGLLERATPALRTVPGVVAVTPIAIPPFFGPQVFNAVWEVQGQNEAEGERPRMPFETGGPDYFRTFGTPLLAGRGFLDSDRDSAPPVAVVSQSAARVLQLGRDPVGQHIRLAGDSTTPWRTVVGVAGDIHYRTLRTATPTVYLPARQWFFQGIFAIRTAGQLLNELPAMRETMRRAYPGATIVRVQTMDDLLGEQLAVPRLSAFLLVAFAGSALFLAALGLYGVIAATVRERTHEFGIRSALGATPARLRSGVLRQALGLSGAGVVIGAGISLVAARFLASQLFEVTPTDPIVLFGACALLLSVAVIAALAPAHRATRTDPAQALRGK